MQSNKNASRLHHLCSAAPQFAICRSSFSSIHSNGALDVTVYLAYSSLLPFLSTCWSPLLTAGLHILFFIVIHATCSFRHNVMLLFPRLLKKGPWSLKKIICMGLNSHRTVVVIISIQNHVPSIHHLHLFVLRRTNVRNNSAAPDQSSSTILDVLHNELSLLPGLGWSLAAILVSKRNEYPGLSSKHQPSDCGQGRLLEGRGICYYRAPPMFHNRGAEKYGSSAYNPELHTLRTWGQRSTTWEVCWRRGYQRHPA